MTYWWELFGYIGRARYELERIMRPVSLLFPDRPYNPGHYVVPVRPVRG